MTDLLKRTSSQPAALAAGLRAGGVRRGRALEPEAHTLLFVLSVLAIVPLAALLSHATESVAAKTGDAVGGLLNATLGNLTELVIALAALRAGQYMLVKASIAGAIVTNTLFMLGASFLLGGLKHHVQEFNRVSARLQAACSSWPRSRCWFRRPSRWRTPAPAAAFTQQSERRAVRPAHRRLRARACCSRSRRTASCSPARSTAARTRSAVADRAGAGHAGGRHGARGARERGVRRIGAAGRRGVRDDAGLRRLHRRGAGRRRGGDGVGVLRRAQEPAGSERRHRARERVADRPVRGAGARAAQLRASARRRWTCASGRARW